MATFNGTSGNDVYGETGGSDTYNLLGGDDTVTIATGYDIVNGGTGTDTLIADYSAESRVVMISNPYVNNTEGGFNGNFYNPNTGATRVDYTSIERFVITTGAGDDIIATATGDDVVNLGAGDDFVNFGSGSDSGDGGTGVDGFSANLSAFGSGVSFDLTSGSAQGGPGTIVNFEYFGVLTTTAFNDTVVTGAILRDETIHTGEGDDTITIAGGYDRVNGGTGTDTLIADYSAESRVVMINNPHVNNAEGGFNGNFYNPNTWTTRVDYTSIERFVITTGAGDDIVATATGDDVVNLGAGDDFVNFGSGSDSGDGGTGVDGFSANLSAFGSGVTIDLTSGGAQGGPGTIVNFEYLGVLTTTAFNDTVVTGAILRDETIHTGEGDDTITIAGGYDRVNGGTGTDTLIADYSAESRVVMISNPHVNNAEGGFNGNFYNPNTWTTRVDYTSIERFVITTGVGDDQIVTGSGNDEIRTGAGNDTVTSGAGNDYLDGGAGDDTMTGGSGNDVYIVDSDSDVVNENANEGNDEIRTSLAAYSLAARPNIENLTGTGSVNQTLTGNAGNNVIDGGAGDDSMTGGAGDDTYFVDSLGDSVIENAGEGFDTVRTGLASYALAANVEQLVGTSNAGQALTGNGGANSIFGGTGNDTLDGGAGDDGMTGGLGNDIYFVDSLGDVVFENAGEGTDAVRTGLAAYTLHANVENLTGTSAAGQSLTGNDLGNIITALGGNDTLDGGIGDDTLDGGAGETR
jgi:Ca2+-binding RTX toxin-like protein